MPRLASLDILRGLDLFLLVFLQPVLWALLTQAGTPASLALLHHFDHEVWEGFRFWDLVMPLFLFMSGTSLPFAFSRHLRGEAPKSEAYRRIARRCLLLFLLGMVVQGNLLTFRPSCFLYYTNTLQAIASGYLIASLLLLHLSFRKQIWAIVCLLAAYTIPSMLWGDFTPEGNLACRIDAWVMGSHRGDPTYAWLLPTLNFGVTVSLGSLAGQVIRNHWKQSSGPHPMENGRPCASRAAWQLALTGILLAVLGLVWSQWFGMPVIKRIWTSSMVLYSGGLCFLLMAVFHYVIDVCRWQRPLGWLKIYGMNSIVAYMLGEVVDFRSVVHSLSYGLAPWLADRYPAWLTFGNFLLLFFLLWGMYRCKVFIKV